MKLSVTASCHHASFAPIIYNGQLEKAVAKATEFHYDAIELHIADPCHVDSKRLLKQLGKEGLVVSTIGTGLAYVEESLSFTDPDESVRREAITRFKSLIELAQELGGAKVILGTIKGAIRPELGEKKSIDYMSKGVEESLELAVKRNIEIVFEAINRYESNCFNTADQVLDFLKRFDSDVLGVHLDTFHMNIEERNIEKTIHQVGKKLKHVHMADSNRRYPGDGHIPFGPIIKALKAIDYQGFLAVEILPLPEPDRAAKEASGFLEAMIAD